MKCLLAVALFGVAAPAYANDSEAELALGGLTLKKSDAIQMESEDLYISRDIVRVKYRFTNSSDAPVETLIAFPLPDIPAEEIEGTAYWSDARELDFTTTIDGRPAPLDFVEQAIFRTEDVSARLSALKIPRNSRAPQFVDALEHVPGAARDKLIADGLLRDDGAAPSHVWTALWSLRTNVTRRQTFPPHATVTVEHQYVPRAGGSVGGQFDPQYRSGENAKYFAETRRKYCIEDDWLKSFDARYGKGKKKEGVAYSEVWLGYVLKTGANWKGPIKDFRLVVDKGKPESLVSFCAENVKKISPTQFESRRKDYTPDRDLNVLIIDWSR